MNAYYRHSTGKQCFIIESQGAQARLDYQLSAAVDHNYRGLVNFSHTFCAATITRSGLGRAISPHWSRLGPCSNNCKFRPVAGICGEIFA